MGMQGSASKVSLRAHVLNICSSVYDTVLEGQCKHWEASLDDSSHPRGGGPKKEIDSFLILAHFMLLYPPLCKQA